MKQTYAKPLLEIFFFEEEDIVRTSVGGSGDGNVDDIFGDWN